MHALGATWRGQPVGSFGRARSSAGGDEDDFDDDGRDGRHSDGALVARVAAVREACAWPSRWLTARYLIKLLAYHVLTEPRIHRLARAAYERLGEAQPLPRPTSPEELRGGWREELERRLANAQAAIGLRQLERLDANLAHRCGIAALYDRLLAERGLSGAVVPAAAAPSWVRYPLLVPDRAAAIRQTHPLVVLGTWFTSVLEEAASPADGGYVAGSCPRAEDAARRLVNLPTHGRVREADAAPLDDALAARC